MMIIGKVRFILLIIAIVLVATATFSFFYPQENDSGCYLDCDTHTYGSCPTGCIKTCVPSYCDSERCTSDCDGEGSCKCPGD